MSFIHHAYPLRMDRQRFPAHLLDSVSTRFTQIVRPRSSYAEHVMRRGVVPEATIGGSRCAVESEGFLGMRSRVRCNYAPQDADRAVVRALLMAWMRSGISDRYLDFDLVRRVSGRGADRPQNADEARLELSRNYPRGCVRFVYNELPSRSSRGDLPIFGDAIQSDSDYNEVYSALLTWDDMFCMGIVSWLRWQVRRNEAQDAGRRATTPTVRATHEWIAEAQRTPGTIYHFVQQYGG